MGLAVTTASPVAFYGWLTYLSATVPRRFMYIILTFTVLLSVVPMLSGATPDSLQSIADSLYTEPDRFDKFVDDLVILGSDGLAYITAPARWSGNDWYYAGGTVLGIGLGTTLDRGTRASVVASQFSPTELDMYTWGSRYGELLYSQVFTAGVYATGLALDHDGIRVTGRLLAESLLFSGTLTITLRYLVGRARPTNTDDPFDFKGFQKTNEVQSFPSGHTTVAFALSSVLASRIDHPVATVLLYGAATLTAVSRVTLNRHWVSDVMTGAAIGTSAGLFVCGLEQQRVMSAEADHSSLRIFPSPDGLAIVLTF